MPFNQQKVLDEVRRILKREKFCLIVVAEGLVDADGNYLAADAATDAFGHARLGGLATLSARSSKAIFRLESARVATRPHPALGGPLRVKNGFRRGIHGRPGGCARRDRG